MHPLPGMANIMADAAGVRRTDMDTKTFLTSFPRGGQPSSLHSLQVLEDPFSLKLSDTRVYEPQIRARLGTTAHFCEVGTPTCGFPLQDPQQAAREGSAHL